MSNNKAKWDSTTNNYNLILLLYLSLYSYSLNEMGHLAWGKNETEL